MTEETRDCAVLLDSLDRREISEQPDQRVRRESLVHMDHVERKETGERDLSVSLLTYLYLFICKKEWFYTLMERFFVRFQIRIDGI